MADVELVIKISEDYYEYIKEMPDAYKTQSFKVIAHGKPLPKGHGRLIDADALYDSTKLCHAEEDGTACVEWREINDATTIIEADEEG